MTFLELNIFTRFSGILTLEKTFSLKKFYICVIDCTNANPAGDVTGG